MISGISTRFETNPGRVVHSHRFFLELLASFIVVSKRRVARLQRPNHFHQHHHRHRIHEVHPHKTVGASSGPPARHRNDRSVLAMITSARKIPAARQAPPLDLYFFWHRFNHENPQPHCPHSVTGCSRPRTIPLLRLRNLPFFISDRGSSRSFHPAVRTPFHVA